MASEEPLKLDWIDLVPEKERKLFDSIGMPASDHSGGAAQQSKIGNVRPELNGSQVKIPGFVIPLEGDADTVTEFYWCHILELVFTCHHRLQTRSFT